MLVRLRTRPSPLSVLQVTKSWALGAWKGQHNMLEFHSEMYFVPSPFLPSFLSPSLSLLPALPSPCFPYSSPYPLPGYNTALPLYSVTRAFCKDLLRKTFTTLLLPDSSKEGSRDLRSREPISDTFKYILNLAKEANSSLLGYHSDVKSLSAAARSSDSGA